MSLLHHKEAFPPGNTETNLHQSQGCHLSKLGNTLPEKQEILLSILLLHHFAQLKAAIAGTDVSQKPSPKFLVSY